MELKQPPLHSQKDLTINSHTVDINQSTDLRCTDTNERLGSFSVFNSDEKLTQPFIIESGLYETVGKPPDSGKRRSLSASLRSRIHSSAFVTSQLRTREPHPSSERRNTINILTANCCEDERKFITELERDSSNVGIGGDNSILKELHDDSWDTDEHRDRSWSVANLREQFIAFFQPSNNRLALKLFGNKVALACERKRQREQGKWVIHPCSNFRLYWNLIMLVLLIANLIMLPVIISFFNDDVSGQWVTFNGISDTVFIFDILVNFRTGIIRNDFVDDIILNPSAIAREYLKTWFALDLLSSIPIDYIFFAFRSYDQGDHLMQAGRALRILRLAKLLSLLRLLRLSRLVRYITLWEEAVNIANKFMGICNLVLIMLLLGHWNACLQFLVPMLMDFPVQSWVSKSKLQHAHWFEQYTWALFKALSHMLSIGYGRYPPSSLPEAWITIVSMMTGATCYALFVGHAAALIQSFDASKRKYREMLKQIEEYMAYKKYPRSLRQRITGYYEHRYKGKMFNEKEILSELSECLREQIINYNCRALVAAVPIFATADQNFVSEVVVRLKQEVFQPGDLIIKEGTIGNKMYFIQEGVVNIIMKSGIIATRLSDGCYFGEICLLTNTRRVATVQADTYCTLYSLDQKSFYEVLNDYPSMRQSLEKVAAERLENIGHRPSILQQHMNVSLDDMNSKNNYHKQQEATKSENSNRSTSSDPDITRLKHEALSHINNVRWHDMEGNNDSGERSPVHHKGTQTVELSGHLNYPSRSLLNSDLDQVA